MMLNGIEVLQQFREALMQRIQLKTSWGKEELKVLIVQVYVGVLEEVLDDELKS